MKKQLTRVSPQQTSKVLALLYFFSSLPFVLLMGVATSFAQKSENSFPIFVVILMPFLYLVFGYVFTLYGAWIYNVIAKRIGGIEITVSDIKNEQGNGITDTTR